MIFYLVFLTILLFWLHYRNYNSIKFDYYPDDSFKYRKEYLNGVLHGITKEWFQVGEIESSETPYVHGKKHGVVKYWYRNGQLHDEIPYINDNRHGIWRRWNKNGDLIMEIPYVNGKQHGEQKIY